MQVEQKVNIHNRFDVEVNGEWVGFAENIVLDQMWPRLVNFYNYFSNIHFGIGSGMPIATRTSLFTHLGTKTAVDVEKIRSLPISSLKKKIVLNPEEYIGSTITEVGIAFDFATTALVTHAMLKDAEGNPISITKTDTDVVTIYATVYITLTCPADVEIIGLPNNNIIINHLLDQGGTQPTTLCIGAANIAGDSNLTSVVDIPIRLITLASTKDIVNKKAKYSRRISITEANQMIREFAFENLFRVKLPNPSIFTKQNYINVPLGTGDGDKKNFIVPSKALNLEDLVLKLNGSLSTDYTLEQVNNSFNFYHAYITSTATAAEGNYMKSMIAITPDKEWVIWTYFRQYSDIKFFIYKKTSKGTYGLFRTTIEGSGYYSDTPVLCYAKNDRIVFAQTGRITWFVYTNGDWVYNVIVDGNIYSADISADGDVLLVGRPIDANVYKYVWNGTTYVASGTLPFTFNNYYGIQISDDKMIVVTTNSDAPRINGKKFNGSIWENMVFPNVLPTHAFKTALSSDGSKLVVADYSAKNVYYYTRMGLNWTLMDTLVLPYNSTSDIWANSDFTEAYVAFDVYPFLGKISIKPDSLEYVSDRPITATNGVQTYISRVYTIQMIEDIIAVGLSSIYEPTSARLYDISKQETLVKFNTPPAAGVTVTSDYSTEGLHKTNQYVVDVSFSIQFGEGV